MGYQKIPNLYNDQTILLFKKCYALEKIHGTSAHISWDGKGKVGFFSGGERHANFVQLFDESALVRSFCKNIDFGCPCVIFGEAYGGKCQGMASTYGPNLKFVAFEVKINDSWLVVPKAEKVALSMGLEFVHYNEIATDLDLINEQRDLPSVQACRNKVGTDKKSEGVVLRPLIEVTLNNGKRVAAKHKRDDFRETKTPRKVSDHQQKIMVEANLIADEYVVPMRLLHVLDKMPQPHNSELTGQVITNMLQDIQDEATDIQWTNNVKRRIAAKTAMLFKDYLKSGLEFYVSNNIKH